MIAGNGWRKSVTIMDDGVLTVCRLVNDAESGEMPRERLVPKSEHCFGERTVGYGRQYAAKGVSEQVDILARIWQDRSIRIGMYAIIPEEGQFRIDNVQHLLDDDGLRVTDLSLSRLEELYDVSAESEMDR